MTCLFFGKREKHRTVREALVLRGDDLGHRVVRGASFTLLGISLRTLITLCSISILAHLLSPTDFGHLAMATVITELAALFGNMGFSSVLIQKRVITRLQMDTVFWASVLLGLCLTVAVFLLSYVAIWLYHEPIVGELMRIMCLVFVIEELAVIHGVLISRLMRFHADFWIQILPLLCRATVAIVFAWQGFGVWSLVAGALAGSLSRVFLSILVIPYWPRWRFNFRYLQSTWKTNSGYFAGGILFYANSNFDLFLIGRLLGASALGYYQNARSLTDEVRYRMAVPLQRVLFPAFSTLQENTGWLQSSVLRSGRLLAAIVFPVGIGIAAIADELVPVLYGAKWLAMVPVLKLLGIRTAVAASTVIASPLFHSRNRVGLALRYNAVGSVIVLLSVAVASTWGMNAVAGAIALSSLYSLVGYRVGLGLIGLSWKDVWSMCAPPACASTVMWLSIEISRAFLVGAIEGGMGELTLHIALGAIVYPLVLIVVSPMLLDDVKTVIAKMRPTAKETLIYSPPLPQENSGIGS